MRTREAGIPAGTDASAAAMSIPGVFQGIAAALVNRSAESAAPPKGTRNKPKACRASLDLDSPFDVAQGRLRAAVPTRAISLLC